VLSRTFRFSACALLAAAAFGSYPVAKANASAASCTPATRGIAGMSAAQAIKTVTANIPKACGFTISGIFNGAAFGDGWQLTGASTYDARGGVHLSWVDQGVLIDFRQVGGAEFVKINAGPAPDDGGMWPGFGITSSAVIKAAGTTKWVRLPRPAAQGGLVYGVGGTPYTAAFLATEVARGSQRPSTTPWRLAGTATVHGVACTVLVNKPLPGSVVLTTQWLYVATATGLPLQIGYYYPTNHKQNVTSFFSNWGHAAVVTPPPASKVVAG
jgi:hypothetical protein